MKKLMQRFFGIAVSAAMLFTSGMTAWADDSHSHDGGTKITGDVPEPNYTITLSYPNVEGGKPSDYFFTKNSEFGAYQIFSGTVEGTNEENPGNTNKKIPITDIKWGSAFCSDLDPSDLTTNDLDPTNDAEGQTNILEFVYALYAAPDGKYSYAFGDLADFKDFFTKYPATETTVTLASKYTSGGSVTFTLDDGKITKIDGLDNADYDKLAVEISDIIAKHDDREWLQEFTDILGGFGKNTTSSTGYQNPGYVNLHYEGNIKGNTEYEITVPAGYYMIRDLSTIDEGAEYDDSHAFSARMLFVANDVAQELKVDVPKLEKKILRDSATVGDTTGKETDVAGVGDVVHFQLDGTLPSNYDNYLGGYKYIFEDTLSKGLDLVKYDDHADYTADSGTYVQVTAKGLFVWNVDKWEWKADATATIPVKVDSSILSTGSSSTDVHLKDSDNYNVAYASQKLTVAFPCLREIRVYGDGDFSSDVCRLGYDTDAKESSKIYVDYYAKVNKDAVVSPKEGTNDNGNFNKAQIQYSDNPQAYGDTDYTTVDRATVYTFGLDIVKIDAAEFLKNGKYEDNETTVGLKDAKFAVVRQKAETSGADTQWEIATFTFIDSITAKGMNPAPAVSSFTENGYYSIVSWEEIKNDASENVKGASFKKEWLEKDYTGEASEKTNGYIIASKAEGILNVSGLDVDVTYTMVETSAPDKYATINPFTIKLEAAKDGDEYTGKLSKAESSGSKATGESFTFAQPVEITDEFSGSPTASESDGSANMLVANFKYTDLPSTGGVGTVWFYILGAGGVGLAGVLFFLSKKKVTK